jgi:phosphoribosylformylglycinamidine cyclo-ligase
VKPVLKLLEKVSVHSLAHITGGGFYENLPRAFGEDLSARIQKGSWKMPEIFPLIQEVGQIPEHDMYNTFNMGIGMCAIVAPEDAETALAVLSANGIHASVIGTMIRGSHDVEFAEEH